jgi:hypothetical protein
MRVQKRQIAVALLAKQANIHPLVTLHVVIVYLARPLVLVVHRVRHVQQEHMTLLAVGVQLRARRVSQESTVLGQATLVAVAVPPVNSAM